MIGDTLKRLRNIYGMKAKDMCAELGISASYLSEIENGKKQPSLELLGKYADIFGLEVSSIVLLSENLERAKARGDGSVFIRGLMLKLVHMMSWDLVDDDERRLEDE